MKINELDKGGEVKKVKTKTMANELGISNNTWNQRLTKARYWSCRKW